MPINERSTAVKVTFPSGQDGEPRLTVHYPGHMSMLMDWPMAQRYAQTVLTAVAHAEHDAAVASQMQNQLGQTAETAAHVVRRLREDRPALDTEALGVLRLEPSVVVPSCLPFLSCSTIGGSTWNWAIHQAMDHATVMLLSCPVADLAVSYWKFLVGRMRVTDDEARCAVADLSRWQHWTAGAKSDYETGCWLTGDPVVAEHWPAQDPTPH